MGSKLKRDDTVIADILALSRCSVQDEAGQPFPLYDLWKNQTAILVFLRHFGCIFCRAHAKDVWNRRNDFEKNGAKIAFIGNGSPHMIAQFKIELGISEAPIYTDPTLAAFKAVGFKRGFLAAVNPRAIFNLSKAKNLGVQQGTYSKEQGDLWQLGGLIVIKPDGKVPYLYISQVAGDFAPAEDENKIASGK